MRIQHGAWVWSLERRGGSPQVCAVCGRGCCMACQNVSRPLTWMRRKNRHTTSYRVALRAVYEGPALDSTSPILWSSVTGHTNFLKWSLSVILTPYLLSATGSLDPAWQLKFFPPLAGTARGVSGATWVAESSGFFCARWKSRASTQDVDREDQQLGSLRDQARFATRAAPLTRFGDARDRAQPSRTSALSGTGNIVRSGKCRRKSRPSSRLAQIANSAQKEKAA